MERVAKFEKVSFEQFQKDYLEFNLTNEQLESTYDQIKMPKRATVGSAGYDFFLPFAIKLNPGETVKIPTGIRVRINDGWVLKLYPRSGLGFKFRLQLNNTVGIIDADYYNSSNEGHIFAKITNDSNEGKVVDLASGMGFMQGIFVQFGITEDDFVEAIRDGGFGSTSK